MEAARATGVPPLGIMRRHLLPNALGPLLVQATVDMGAVILVAAGLSFIGLGPQPPTADWGMMINQNRLGHKANPRCVLAPALQQAVLALRTNHF